MWKTMISSLLMSTIVMLAISVLVALVGVANTLSLSVVERRRENALLRALGMTKANVRKMITLETVLIAGVSVFLGILMGVAFGTLGLMALPLNFSDAGQDFHRVVSIPWLQVGGAILVAFGAAMLSSIMPGRRAAKASPIEAMAEIE